MAARKEAAANAGKDMARRFRPIAPRPSLPAPPPAPLMRTMGDTAAGGGSSTLWQPRKRGRQEHLPLSSPVPKRERDVESSSYPPPPAPVWQAAGGGYGGASSSHARRRPIPVERPLISQLQAPIRVIKPRAARPRRTTICIDSSNIASAAAAVSKKTAREVEAELDLPGALPAVVSGQHNRVHLANDAYKAMVGQPVCPWLDSVPGAGASRRINGVVVLHVRRFSPPAESSSRLPPPPDMAGGGGAFPCAARISWECDGAIASLTVPCAVERLTGDSGDYLFIWRFDSSRASIIYCIA